MNTPVVADLENTTNEIPSLLVPMVSCKLVLPTVSVAEMTPYQPPGARQAVVTGETPDWYLGNLQWRGILVPMVSYELLNGEPIGEIQPESQVIILNSTGVSSQMTFVCMPTQGIPRLSRVAVNEISENTEASVRDYDEMQVYVAGEQAVIPNVTKIEQACAQLLGYG